MIKSERREEKLKKNSDRRIVGKEIRKERIKTRGPNPNGFRCSHGRSLYGHGLLLNKQLLSHCVFCSVCLRSVSPVLYLAFCLNWIRIACKVQHKKTMTDAKLFYSNEMLLFRPSLFIFTTGWSFRCAVERDLFVDQSRETEDCRYRENSLLFH